jgi:hypothetical protein
MRSAPQVRRANPRCGRRRLRASVERVIVGRPATLDGMRRLACQLRVVLAMDRAASRRGHVALLLATCLAAPVNAGCSSPLPLGTGTPAATDGAAGASGASGTAGKNVNGEVLCHTASECPAPGPANVRWKCNSPYVAWACGPLDHMSLGMTCNADSICPWGLVCGQDPSAPSGSDAHFVCMVPVVCTSDSQCGPTQVCREVPNGPTWSPWSTERWCSARCATDLDCLPMNRCDETGHCQPRTCARCPSYFSCAGGTCSIPTCAKDADCSGGYCVGGFCAGMLGTCIPICF